MTHLMSIVPPHAPSCDVPETVMRGSSVELHCKDKLSVPPAMYSWYKDNKPLNTAHLPEINYILDHKTGTLVGFNTSSVVMLSPPIIYTVKKNVFFKNIFPVKLHLPCFVL